jgi:hypothetical protein
MEGMKKTTDRPLPSKINCGGCQKTLQTATHQRFPPHDTPKDKIHDIIDPTSPSFSIGVLPADTIHGQYLHRGEGKRQSPP